MKGEGEECNNRALQIEVSDATTSNSCSGCVQRIIH
jgi:hypothetical protein